jgi:hypothetical protein
MTGKETLEVLDRRWRSACKVVFKEEMGPLSDFLPYLSELLPAPVRNPSSASGKEVTYAISEYAPGSKWISFDEIHYGKPPPALNINDIKDFDSLLAAVSERAEYCGNIILGNSGFVEKSSSISDSFHMHNTTLLSDCKHNACVSTGRLCNDSFGTYGPGESEFCIRCTQTYRDKRCFEAWVTQNCSDIYYSYNLNNCTDCLFCFNAKSKRHAIGNLELGKGKYAAIKEKLLSEMADGLKKNKRLPSLMEIVQKSPFEKPEVFVTEGSGEDELGKKAAEEAFRKTSRLLIGKELPEITRFRNFLERHTHRIEERKSAASGKQILMVPASISIPPIPENRVLTTPEALAHGEKTHIDEAEAESLSLANAHKAMAKLAFFNVEFSEGTNSHLSECTTYIENSFCFRCSAMVYSKYCGYTFYPRSSEHAFGCNQLFDSSFCINCYHSVKLQRCFEMDSCRNCSDCYYCHNVENCTDCMFCFNVKSKRYAIGNVEVGKAKYLQIKALLLSEITKRLEKSHDCGIDIYNVGVQGKRK